MVELRDLEAFVTVAQEQGIRAAAAILSRDPGTVSRAINRLERAVGVPLLSRDATGVTLTPAGRLFVGEARSALAHTGRAVLLARHAGRPDGGDGDPPVVVGFPPIPAVPEVNHVLAHIRRAARQRQYRVRRLSWREDFSGDRVRNGGVDIAISVLPGTATGLMAVALRPVPRVVAVPITHRLARARTVAPSDLDGIKAVAPLTLSDEALAFWTLNPQTDGKTRRLARRPRSVSDLLGDIADGAGFLTLPAFIPLMWQRSDLAFRRLDAPQCSIGITWNSAHVDQDLQDRLIDGRQVLRS